MRRIKFSATCLLLVGSGLASAQNIDDSNCMRHLGGGGFGDFDCYTSHAKSLIALNKVMAEKLKKSMPPDSHNRVRLDNYMRAQNREEKYCVLPVEGIQGWRPEKKQKTHIDLYDVAGAKCRYDIRKHQNEFLQGILDDVAHS